ncbi:MULTISPECIES: hypothetical protein [Streptomyces]|uniref:Uncharacterized protein n=1 Tax=Streptomyces fradiae ATCC 10745 = DSM 40063 TaxID=1319510 RepID=A0A1Y2NRX9_STRFR|nr:MULTISPECIES: hypothetical protein [Streptomyces]KAF0650970.1 hypothetical protein K701_06210 [Streptomyces fradiae ATCC 10745 = DSM 40063]OSY49807.1 hypothetical protein BG846_04550 [Streptomyces fradiae ATCC 10745 = DSM 40063]QEV13216.1 hypothetical protein CP974_15815 [Streptomyces fradiae ATCC 10745 = DSM 40063]WOI63353.1 hypothetical protein RYQ63_27675 [Streptomyces fradiae]
MPFPALGGVPLSDNHLLRTLASATDSGKESLLIMGVLLACVINGDTVTGVLRQATWLVIVVIVLQVVQLLQVRLPRPRVKPVIDA